MVSEFEATLGCKGWLCNRPATHRRMSSEDHSTLHTRNDSKKTRPGDSSLSGKLQTRCCRKRQRPKCPSAHAKTTLWQHPTNALAHRKNQPSQVALRAAETATTWRCHRQQATSDRWNQTATTTRSVTWKCCGEFNEGNAYVDDADDGFTDEMTGAREPRARAESQAWTWIRLLNRCVMSSNTRLTWEADTRHAELAVAELGLEAARPQTRPGCAKPKALLNNDNWSQTGRRRITGCQQDWLTSRQTGPISRSLAKNAAAQSGKQHKQISRA